MPGEKSLPTPWRAGPTLLPAANQEQGPGMETADRILETAEALIQERGFFGFSFQDIAEKIGLNRDDFLTSLGNAELENLVDADVQQARDLELRGVPALIFESKYYIPGAQPYEELVRFVEKMEARLEQEQ